LNPSGLITAAQRIAEAAGPTWWAATRPNPPLGADPASAWGRRRAAVRPPRRCWSAALGEQALGLAATAAQLLNVSAGFMQQDLFKSSGLKNLGVPDLVTVPVGRRRHPPIPPDLRPPLLPPPPLPGEVLSTAVHSGDPHGGEAFVARGLRVAAKR